MSLRIKKKVAISLSVGVIVVLLTGVTVRYGFTLTKVNERNIVRYELSQSLQDRVKNETEGMGYKEIVTYSMRLTGELLEFAMKNDVYGGKANCIGYAQVGAGICNFALACNRLGNRAKPVVGYVNLFGINLCEIVPKMLPKRFANFVKDHDFIELETDGQTIYFDPSLYDYFIDCTTYKNFSKNN